LARDPGLRGQFGTLLSTMSVVGSPPGPFIWTFAGSAEIMPSPVALPLTGGRYGFPISDAKI